MKKKKKVHQFCNVSISPLHPQTKILTIPLISPSVLPLCNMWPIDVVLYWNMMVTESGYFRRMSVERNFRIYQRHYITHVIS